MPLIDEETGFKHVNLTLLFQLCGEHRKRKMLAEDRLELVTFLRAAGLALFSGTLLHDEACLCMESMFEILHALTDDQPLAEEAEPVQWSLAVWDLTSLFWLVREAEGVRVSSNEYVQVAEWLRHQFITAAPHARTVLKAYKQAEKQELLKMLALYSCAR